MNIEFDIISKNLEDTNKIAKAVANVLCCKGFLICLYGDIGSGKTTFVKALAAHLGIKEKVTSPSFVIINEYHAANISLYHFDLYRLEEEGLKTIIDELHEYTENDNAIAIIEWAEFSCDDLPEERLEIKIKYIDENSRKFIFKSFGENCKKITEKIKPNYENFNF